MKFIIILIFTCNFYNILCNLDELKSSDEDEMKNDVTIIQTDDQDQNGYSQNLRDFEEDDHRNNDDYTMQGDEPVIEPNNNTEIILETTTENENVSTSEETSTITTHDVYYGTQLLSTTPTETVGNAQNISVHDNLTVQTTTEIGNQESRNGLQSTLSLENNQIEDINSNGKKLKTVNVNKLSDQIRIVLRNYKESGHLTVPNIPIPDPMHIPDMQKSIAMMSMGFKNQTVYGLSNFTVQHINTDLEKMQVYVMVHMDRLQIFGNYSKSTFFSRSSGPFNVTIFNVTAEGAAALHYTEDGSLEASETDMDMSFEDIELHFTNFGMSESLIGAAGNIIFQGIKPAVLAEVNTKMKSDLNVKLRSMTIGIKPNTSISPVDQAVLEGRRFVKRLGYDPYNFKNFTTKVGIFNVIISEFTLAGVSKFYKVGDVELSMDKGTVEFGIHIATDKLIGNCSWCVFLGKQLIRKGTVNFTVDHIQIKGNVRQSLDLSNPPRFHDLDFLVGDIELTTHRKDAIDLYIELVSNRLPKIIKHAIVDGIEEPVKHTGQKILNLVDVEKIVDEQLPVLDKLGF